LRKIIEASPEIPGMTREEVERFLESKLNLQPVIAVDFTGFADYAKKL
jgi:hypothetical protein